MSYGKYPFEPYGYQGGYYRKNNQSLAAAIGGLVGLIIRAIVILAYKLGAGTIKFLSGCSSKAFNGIKAGLRDAIRTRP